MKKILLAPLGGTSQDLIRTLRDRLSGLLHVPVALAKIGWDVGCFYDEVRGQSDSTRILQHLRDHLPDGFREGDKIIAVFDGDLYIPILTFVFGEAEFGGVAAIVSYHRLRNECYGLPPDPGLLLQRMCKEVLHEIGHTVGLLHCLSPQCAMHASNDAGEVDLKGGSYCRECRAVLLQHFEVSSRQTGVPVQMIG